MSEKPKENVEIIDLDALNSDKPILYKNKIVTLVYVLSAPNVQSNLMIKINHFGNN